MFFLTSNRGQYHNIITLQYKKNMKCFWTPTILEYFLTPSKRSHALVAVCPSFLRSFRCEPNTVGLDKGVTFWTWLHFGVDPVRDVDLGSFFLLFMYIIIISTLFNSFSFSLSAQNYTFSTSLSHHYHWTAFSYLDCMPFGLLMLIGCFIFISLFF